MLWREDRPMRIALLGCGTVGGGVYMNAGAYGGEMSGICRSMTLMDGAGQLREVNARELEFSYRHSKLQESGEIVISAVLQLQPAAPEELQPGEIVAYRSGSSVVIHRLVENHIVEGELVTKGDANAEPDPLKVEYAGVLGTVTAHIPFIGIYAGALNTLPGKLYAFGFIVAAAMLYLLAHELSE